MTKNISMVISVMDCDQPGIVAEITSGIDALGGNLADLSQTVLCGYFTMILVADFPATISMEQVEKQLVTSSTARVSVVEGNHLQPETEGPEEAYVLSAIGENREGLVARVSQFCFDRSVNILDLASHAEDGQYTMMLQLDLSNVESIEQFDRELSAFGNESGLNIAFQHNDIFKATNEI